MSTQQIAFDLATEAIDTDVLGQRRIYFEFEPCVKTRAPRSKGTLRGMGHQCRCRMRGFERDRKTPLLFSQQLF